MNFVKRHKLLLLFIFALIIRLLLIFYDYSWDVNNHMVWAKDFLTRGPGNFYESISSNAFATLFPNYPPGAIYIFVVVRLINPIIHNIYWWLNLHIPLIPSNLIFFLEKTVFLAGLMKIPAILADLGVALISYKFAQKIIPKNRKLQVFAAVSILFNPVFIFNSSLWGQIDSLPIFFVLLSVYCLLYSKRKFTPAVFFTLALLIKPTTIVFAPVWLIVFLKRFDIKILIANLILCNLIFILAFLPFAAGKNIYLYPYQTYIEKIVSAQSLSFATNGAFNFWAIVTQMKNVKDTTPFVFGISYRMIGYLMTGFVVSIGVFFAFKKNKTNENLFAAMFITSFAFFLFLTKMHERYSMLPLVFLMIISLKERKYFKWFICLSLFSLINHYSSWSVPRIEAIEILKKTAVFPLVFSLLNILAFVYLFKTLILKKIKV